MPSPVRCNAPNYFSYCHNTNNFAVADALTQHGPAAPRHGQRRWRWLVSLQPRVLAGTSQEPLLPCMCSICDCQGLTTRCLRVPHPAWNGQFCEAVAAQRSAVCGFCLLILVGRWSHLPVVRLQVPCSAASLGTRARGTVLNRMLPSLHPMYLGQREAPCCYATDRRITLMCTCIRARGGSLLLCDPRVAHQPHCTCPSWSWLVVMMQPVWRITLIVHDCLSRRGLLVMMWPNWHITLAPEPEGAPCYDVAHVAHHPLSCTREPKGGLLA